MGEALTTAGGGYPVRAEVAEKSIKEDPMSDIMRPMPFGHLMNWALEEYRKEGSFFGVPNPVRHIDGQALPIFDEKVEAPFGPAAGPHTQLAQNIIAAYAAGARFFELKTVQQMDGP